MMRYVLLLLLGLSLLAPLTASAAIARDNSASGGQTGSTPSSGSFSITVGTLSNAIAICAVGVGDPTNPSTPSVTFGGVAMTYYGFFGSDTNAGGIFYFYLASPPQGGTQTVAWTQGASKAIYIWPSCATYSGAAQTSPIENSASTGGSLSTVTVTSPTITSTDWAIITAYGQRTFITSSNITELQGAGNNYLFGDSNGTTGTSISQSMTVSGGAADSNAYAIYLKAASAPSGYVNGLKWLIQWLY